MAQVAVPLGKHGTVFSRDNRDSSISCNVVSMLSARIDRLLSPLSLVKSVSTDPAMLLQLLLVEFHGTCQFYFFIFVNTKISCIS